MFSPELDTASNIPCGPRTRISAETRTRKTLEEARTGRNAWNNNNTNIQIMFICLWF